MAQPTDIATVKGVRAEPTEESEFVRGTLYPGSPRRPNSWWQNGPTFRVFRTYRVIKTFDLTIERLDDEASEERCFLEPLVSYTSKIDFKNQTVDDCIGVRLSLLASSFDRLREMILNDQVYFVGIF